MKILLGVELIYALSNKESHYINININSSLSLSLNGCLAMSSVITAPQKPQGTIISDNTQKFGLIKNNYSWIKINFYPILRNK